MDNNMINTDQQALAAMPQVKAISEQDDIKEMKRKEKRFQTFGAGSFFYALFYTFCLYHNASGITYPFFAGGTLLFFGYFIRKSESSSADGKKEQTKVHINKMFLMISITAYIKGSMTMLFGGICYMFTPAGDMAACRHMRHISNEEDGDNVRNANRGRLLKSVGIGLVIVMPMVLFIAILLASADEVFRMLLYDILTFSVDIEGVEHSIQLIFMILVVFAVCYGSFAYNTVTENKKTIDDMARTEKINWDSYIAVTVNGVMCVMYIVFSGIQIFGLFLGKLPEGYTYASYARHGFFELVQKEEFMGARKFNFSRAYASYKIGIEDERCELF